MAYNLSLCASRYLFLHDAVLRRQLQNTHCIYFQEKRIDRFKGLPHKKKNENNCTDLGGQDVIGQGLFGAVFVTKYTRREDGDLARKGEKAIVKKLLGSSLDFIDAFAKEARLLYDPQAGQHSWIQSCMPRSSGPYAGICLF